MPNRPKFVRQRSAVLLAIGLIASLLPGFAATLCAQTVEPKSVLGDTTMPSSQDTSQNFPYGITGKTPPSLIKINYEGQASYHKHRINLRIFQGCPQVEISEGGRLWATWFGSNVQAERAPYHKDQFSVISTSADGGETWKEVYIFDPSELLGLETRRTSLAAQVNALRDRPASASLPPQLLTDVGHTVLDAASLLGDANELVPGLAPDDPVGLAERVSRPP